MTFDLIRVGWPNTAAILALAMMPMVALTTVAEMNTTMAITRYVPAYVVRETVVPASPEEMLRRLEISQEATAAPH